MSAFSMSSMQARFGFGFSSHSCDRQESAPRQAPDRDSSRAFILEMLDRHPEAFASDHDVRSMMLLFPDQY